MLKRIEITICEDCLNGIGSECHTPGCALFLHRVDLPIHKELYRVLPNATQPSNPVDGAIKSGCKKCGGDHLTLDCDESDCW